ncbi:MAG: DUF1684 domain-containing protein [Candidatus Krumholzibacteriia bacterium]
MDIRRAPKQLLLGSLLVLAGLTATVVQAGDRSGSQRYRDEINAWQVHRLDRLRSPTGYLSLTGLYWLREGKNSFGSDPSNDIVFRSKDAPPRMGVIYLEQGGIRMEARAGTGIQSNGKMVENIVLHHDTDAEHKRTELVLGTMTWYVIKRGERFGIRLKDSESETLREFKTVERFPVDERWRIDGRFETYDPPKHIPITSVGDIHTNEASTGAVVFDVDGVSCRLDVLAEPGDETLFVIFGDETSGSETYGGGRFLVVRAPGEDGRVVLDFNKAYNPPCAFSDFTTCPLPPRQNHIPVRVTAGEKVYKKHKS